MKKPRWLGLLQRFFLVFLLPDFLFYYFLLTLLLLF